MQDLLRYFVPWAAASVAPDDLQRATCASTQQTDRKLQNDAEVAGVHGGNDEADSVVDADPVDWIQVQLHHCPAASQLHAASVVLSSRYWSVLMMLLVLTSAFCSCSRLRQTQLHHQLWCGWIVSSGLQTSVGTDHLLLLSWGHSQSMSAPGLGVLLERHSSCGQACCRTTDISAACCQGQETSNSRYKGNDTVKAGLMHLLCIPYVRLASYAF